ncbi:HAD family hydrolase [Alteromonas gilva]|uniref:HAD family phosphatase n=1 Tax=Alteromonas gilva TaxID=2987522 RepID=A0ABT5L7M5_9ALTE|nr:HAD family phosphatase [Alteromonas gilva]MDC8833050.1 HAD family phosphatase [Alteromonas gilva]
MTAGDAVSTLQAVLFDHDGTLIDSEAVHFGLWQETLKPFGVTLTEQYYNDVMAGVPTPQNGTDVVRDFNLNADPQQLANIKTELTKAYLDAQPFPLMPFAKETLTLCHQRGLRIAIVTGGSKYSVQRTLSSYGFAEWVECVVAVEDVENSKPAPDCYLKALTVMGLSAQQAIAVEDTEHGLRAAVGAGLQCVAIPTAQSAGHNFTTAIAQYRDLSEWTEAQFNRP